MSTAASPSSLEAPKVRVLLVDDSPSVRQELHALLDLVNEVEVLGEAANGADALEQARLLQPDVILLDLEMPVMDGYTTACRLKPLLPCCRLVALTVHSSETDRKRAFRAGIGAYVVKGSPVADLIKAITIRCNAV